MTTSDGTLGSSLRPSPSEPTRSNRLSFIGGSDARIIMGSDEAALVRLWQEKRGEVEPEDLSGNLIVQLGVVTEDLNRRWYEANTGEVMKDVQRWVKHPVLSWMAATLDGCREHRGGVRGEVHAALGLLRRSRRRKAHGAASAQHVGGRAQGSRSCRSSPAAASGSRSRSMPIRSINTFCSPPRRSSGAASRPARRLACSGSSRPGPESRRSASST